MAKEKFKLFLMLLVVWHVETLQTDLLQSAEMIGTQMKLESRLNEISKVNGKIKTIILEKNGNFLIIWNEVKP